MKKALVILLLVLGFQNAQSQSWSRAYLDSIKAFHNTNIWMGSGTTRWSLFSKDSVNFQNVSGDTARFDYLTGMAANRFALWSDTTNQVRQHALWDKGGLWLEVTKGSRKFFAKSDSTLIDSLSSGNGFLTILSSGNTRVLTVDTTKTATGSNTGFLSYTDWHTFNNKADVGLWEIDMTGGLMPTAGSAFDAYWEIDENGDLRAKGI